MLIVLFWLTVCVLLYLNKSLHLHLPLPTIPDRKLNPNMDILDLLKCIWAQNKQIQENQRQLDWLEALLDHLMAGLP